MEKITTSNELKLAIQLLEAERTIQLDELKDQFNSTYDSLKPANILKNTLSEITDSPYLIENILSSSLALISGYFSKKMVVGSSESPIRKIFGTIVQYGITNLVAKHTDDIKSFGQFIVQYFLQKTKPNTEEDEPQ
jgi:hypothetical protein